MAEAEEPIVGGHEKESRKRQREKTKFDFERNNRTIFVGNLPASYDHRDVAKLFKACGAVESARIRSVVPDKEKLAPRVASITKRIHPKIDSVNAYVVFGSEAGDDNVKKALSLNGKLIDGHHIRVDRAIVPNAKRMTLTSRKKSIFVGNLRFDIRDDNLIRHFNKVGPVNYVRIVRDRATGLGKGFGFVVFNERASVKKALELNESSFKGRDLRIKRVDEEEKKTKKKIGQNKGDKVESEGPQSPESKPPPKKHLKSVPKNRVTKRKPQPNENKTSSKKKPFKSLKTDKKSSEKIKGRNGIVPKKQNKSKRKS